MICHRSQVFIDNTRVLYIISVYMLDKIMSRISKLNPEELRELHNHIGSMLHPAVVYQQKPAKCGCVKCKEGGPGHGLYWYAYFRYLGKTHCIYIGKEKREINPLVELEKKNARRAK